jgi:hypothetical protein
MEYATKQLHHHKILERAQVLHNHALQSTFTTNDKTNLIQLDTQLTEILLSSERQCSKSLIQRDPWSPTLKKKGKAIVYWRHKLTSLSHPDGLPHTITFKRLQRAAGISDLVDINSSNIKTCKLQLQQAWAEFKIAKKTAANLREAHLTNLADHLATQSNTSREKAVKIITSKEQDKTSYRQIANALGKTKGSITQIDIPNTDGSWSTITHDQDIYNAILEYNQQHLRQANETPFGQQGNLAYLVNPSHPENQIDPLLDGEAYFDETTSLEMDQWITELQRKTPHEIDTTITETDYIKCFKSMKESKASSPSGRHVGHYIVAAKAEDPTLRQIYCHIAATAFIMSLPLPRWEQCLQVMLDKGKGHRIDKLRIIQLVEADLNFVLKLIWGHRLNQAAYQNQLYNESQFAIIGKTCTSAMLNKVLFADITRQSHRPACMTDNDNKAAFDRILPALSIVTCRRLGLPNSAAFFIFSLLKHMEFKVGTGHGISPKSYGAHDDPSKPGQGSGQGQGSGPMLYGASADITLSAYTQHCTGAIFQHPSNLEPPREDHVSQFVDDATQYVNMEGIQSRLSTTSIENLITNQGWSNGSPLTPIANRNSHKWSAYNWASGGKLNYDKCFWYLLHPVWKKTKYVLASNDDIRGDLDVTDLSTGYITRIPRLEPSNAQRTLGVIFAPDGNNTQQLTLLKEKTQQWANSIRTSNLRAHEKWIAYRSVLKPGILYPLPTHQCTANDLSPIQNILDREILHSQSLNSSFPRAVLHGPTKYGGLGIASIHSESLSDKVLYFLHHIRRDDTVGHKLRCSLGTLQIEIGIGQHILQTDHNNLGFLATNSFITDIWRECSKIGISFRGNAATLWIPPLQSDNDQYIMDIASKHCSKKQLVHINICRLFTNAITISDLTFHDGQTIHPQFYNCRGDTGRRSNYSWPSQVQPPRHYVKTWRLFLSTVLGYPSLHLPLGAWHTLHQYSQRLIYQIHIPSGKLYLCDNSQEPHLQFDQLPFRGQAKFNPTPTEVALAPTDLKPADVLIDTNKITLLGISDRIEYTHPYTNVHQNRTNHPYTLREHFLELPTSLQRLCGHISFPPDNGKHLADAAMDTRLLGVSDGSVKGSRATHAWTLTSGHNSEFAMSGSGPVDGNQSTLSSFRAEVQGQVALLIMMTLLTKTHQLSLPSFTSICDNQGALKRLQPLETGLRLHHHKEADVDLLLTFRKWSSNNITRTPRWVKGHQDTIKGKDKLTEIEKINVDIDQMADTAYGLPEHLRTTTDQDVLPDEMIAAYLNNNKITSHLKQSIINAYHSPTMETYIHNKHKLSEYDMDHINWKGIKGVISNQKMNQRAITTKFMHDWLPTQAFLYKQNRTPSPCCPICCNSQDNETSAHVLQCQHPDAIEMRHAALNKCLKSLQVAHTSPIITYSWNEALRRELHLPPTVPKAIKFQRPFWIDKAVKEARQHQNIIGWDKFLRGFISSKWITAQNLHLQAFPPNNPESCRNWEYVSTKCIMQIGPQTWAWRNIQVHGKTIKDKFLNERELTLQQVKNIYLDPPSLLRRFPAVHEVPLEVRTNQTTRKLLAWICNLDQQINITQAERHRDCTNLNNYQISRRISAIPLVAT